MIRTYKGVMFGGNPSNHLAELEAQVNSLVERIDALESWVAGFEDEKQSRIDEALKVVRSNLLKGAE